MKEKKLSQMILKLHDRAEAAKYDGDSSPPYQEVEIRTAIRNGQTPPVKENGAAISAPTGSCAVTRLC